MKAEVSNQETACTKIVVKPHNNLQLNLCITCSNNKNNEFEFTAYSNTTAEVHHRRLEHTVNTCAARFRALVRGCVRALWVTEWLACWPAFPPLL